MTVEELKLACAQLPDNDVHALRNWLNDYAEDRWDEEVSRELAAGRTLEQIYRVPQSKTQPDTETSNCISLEDLNAELRKNDTNVTVSLPRFVVDYINNGILIQYNMNMDIFILDAIYIAAHRLSRTGQDWLPERYNTIPEPEV